MLFLCKDWRHSLALPLKEKGNNLILKMSPSTSLYFCISQSSTKLFKCKATASPAPENCSFIRRFNKASLISYEGVEVAGGAIGVQIKSLLLRMKAHNLVFSLEPILTTTSKSNVTFFLVFLI